MGMLSRIDFFLPTGDLRMLLPSEFRSIKHGAHFRFQEDDSAPCPGRPYTFTQNLRFAEGTQTANLAVFRLVAAGISNRLITTVR
jgi:hypothetical protein